MKRVSDRMKYMKLDIDGVMMTVISAYAPQVWCLMEEKDKFWTEGGESGDRGRFQWTCGRREQRQ